jgi:hypothetical protein
MFVSSVPILGGSQGHETTPFGSKSRVKSGVASGAFSGKNTTPNAESQQQQPDKVPRCEVLMLILLQPAFL